ncbi:MAG: hypothetical protein AB2A00_43255 [Myxococcota bacterium]
MPDAGTSSSSSSGYVGPAPGTLGGPCVTTGCPELPDGGTCETTLSGEPVPDGTCVSDCVPNQACQGGAGRCISNGLVNQCVLACEAAASCERPGFSCFNVTDVGRVCLPTTRSQCSPSTNVGCADGETCTPAGPDDVGVCLAGCSPEKQDCPGRTDAGPTQGCYFDSTRKFCAPPVDPQPDYAPCSTTNGCQIGRTCVQIYDVPRCYFTCDHEAPQPRCPEGNCQPLFGAHLCVPDEPTDGGL